MGHLGRVAIRALGKNDSLEVIVRTAFAGAGGGMSTFRIRHFLLQNLLFANLKLL